MWRRTQVIRNGDITDCRRNPRTKTGKNLLDLAWIDRQSAELLQFHLLKVGWRAGAREPEFPDDVAAQRIERGFLTHSAGDRQRSVPGEKVERPPAIEDHRHSPAVLDPRPGCFVVRRQFFGGEVR